MSDFQVSPELLSIYLEDARSHLEALDHCLLTLEREGHDADVVASVLGPLHTLKGNSGMIGFVAIKEYVHRLEDVFGLVGDGRCALDSALFDSVFAGASALREAVELACRENREVRALEREKAALDGILRQDRLTQGASEAAAPPPQAPAAEAEPASAAPGPRRAGEGHYVSTRSSMVRVDFGQLDNLLNLVGELIIFRTKLQQAGQNLAARLGREASRELLDTVQHVAGVSSQLQETVMDIRMLPVRHVFERFPRLVRDLAREQGKDIELILEGEGTRVDKAIIDEIGEPLVHLIRNSVDHGIETPRVRVSRGKTPTGTILLSASQESNQVVITIMDDGAGIDPDLVRRKALDRGILKGGETLTDREAVQLIFSQGFSTSDAVTDVSGRGVGLDVVLKSIERLNGLVEVESVPGVGSKFIIQLPLTLAIIAALLIEVSGRTYAIPLASVVESLKLREHEVHRINGRETLRLRERLIPLARLAELFALPAAPRASGGAAYAVVLGRGDKRLGLVVDRLHGQQEVVIKALDPTVSGAAFAVAGATILGDGRVVLILDVASLFDGRKHSLLPDRPPTAAAVEG